MYISRLLLKSFRNYENETIFFSPGINIITGKNGSGKTNILEAVYILSHVKSFKNCLDSDIVTWGNKEYFICVDVKNSHNLTIEAGVGIEDHHSIKKVKIDSKEIKKLTEFYGIIKVVAFFPDDISIIYGSPDTVRKYYDRFFSKIDREYLELLSSFKKILKNRNKLLKDLEFKRDIIKQLDIWDAMYSDCVYKISKKRVQYINIFNQYFNKVYKEISGFDDNLEIIYTTQCDNNSLQSIQQMLLKKRNIDIQWGTTTIGPHRDSYCVMGMNKKIFKSYASTGQRRLASIAMKMAEVTIVDAMSGHISIVMLDDVLSELDEERRINVIHKLTINNHQIIITCANMSDIQFLNNYKLFNVINNRVVEQ